MGKVNVPRQYPSCGEFGKLTGDFIVNTAKPIGNPIEGPQPHLAEFRQLTAQFERDAITALRIGDPGIVPGLLDIYTSEVLNIFLGGPDTIPELVADYKADVKSILLQR